MTVTSIIENTSQTGLPVEHGLSLYIQLDNGRKLLFDMGQGCLFAKNAEHLGLSIAEVDTAIISHGHYDHGGGLRTFLDLNSQAKVYIHKDAFQPHYSLRENGLTFIGLRKELEGNGRLILTDGVTQIDDHMTLFAEVHGDSCCPVGNRLLFGPTETQHDTFSHEQNLIIEEGDQVILLAGCAHSGIVNILRRAEEVIGRKPTHVLAGMHLVKSGLSEAAENAFIGHLAHELMAYEDCKFYTMHCTGMEQYQKLKNIMGDQIEYLSCGDSLSIGITVTTAGPQHHHYIPDILAAIYEASKVKGNSIVMRDPDYLAQKMNEGKAVIALDGDKFAGFCYLESWEQERFIANSGLIVKPEYRGHGLASKIKKGIFDICRTMFPDGKIFSITKSAAVIKMNTRLGFKEVPYSLLTTDPKFWAGCRTCPHYQKLLDNQMQSCDCHGLLFDPEQV